MRQIPFPRNVEALARSLAEACRDAPGWCWLDGEAESGWSYLGAATEVRLAEPGREREFLDSLRADHVSTESGFSGGWVVSLGYELGVALLGVEPASDEAAPGLALRLDVVLAINEAEQRAELRGLSEAGLDAWIERFGASLFSGSEICPSVRETTPSAASTSARWRQSDEAYLTRVEQAKRSIAEGDAYVLCLTDTATVVGEFDPLELYLDLRQRGAAIRGGVIVTKERALVSASPEQFLSVRGGTVSTHPIKGTRPRGADRETDRALASELATDPKELAENLMIVDLMRNDLSRVCDPGSVRVDGFRRVEQHPHVHQLVSTVSGQLKEGLGANDAILACFPGGSMTGTPKKRAVEILADLELGPRGLYSGCFGWLSDAGNAELAMTIRAVELRDRHGACFREARVGAGGGITVDSDPEAELKEKQLKAASLLSALEAHRPGA
ncbi:anthranilate synthase component I family protein [Leucobacter viscericola]|uniref:Anthranilate synthase component I family protein n=1 Tax=Leucobacter viscericola TaxID=2714935 RepID=A0A6G7XJ63_9MICO|nr:anthranilate synthase component I family protein [Leucobacter viscericola]